MQQIKPTYWKWKFVLLLLVFPPILSFCQTTNQQKILVAPKIPYSLTRHPKDLAEALTTGKTTEKEKFDAIFSWVVNNVRYNTRLYNSGKGFASNRSVGKVLRNRRGICTDYAKLMDVLCEYAGITSTTVTGYAKEITFDVGDPLYVDNHAWNAVKLDGNWHLYDATWSSGGVVYEYTRCSKRRNKWIDKLLKKEKIKTIDLKIPQKSKDCGLPSGTVLKSIEVSHLPFFPRVLIAIIDFFPYRVKEKYRAVVNLDYYLTSPEVFSLDHFPTDATWALFSPISNVSDFERDSAFYFRDGSEYKNMPRIGQTCIACDDVLALDSLAEIKRKISSSINSNKKNHFLPGTENLKLAQIYYKKMLLSPDSLTTFNWFDSSVVALQISIEELQKSRPLNNEEYVFQSKKNKAKKRILEKENKVYLYEAKKAWNAIQQRNIKYKSLIIKAKFYSSRNLNDNKTIQRALYRGNFSKALNEVRIEKLHKKFSKYESESQDLTIRINSLQDSLIVHFSQLWKNIGDQNSLLQPLLQDFSKDKKYRTFYLMDNYDRIIKELRDSIALKHPEFLQTIDEKILQLADKSYAEYKQMNLLIKKRNGYFLSSAKILSTLYNGKALSKENLNEFGREKTEIIEKNICWNYDNKFLIQSLVYSYENFHRLSRTYFRIINNDTKKERARYEVFHRHISRNKARLAHAIDNNRRVNKVLKKKVYGYRRNYKKYLKSLRQNRSKRRVKKPVD